MVQTLSTAMSLSHETFVVVEVKKLWCWWKYANSDVGKTKVIRNIRNIQCLNTSRYKLLITKMALQHKRALVEILKNRFGAWRLPGRRKFRHFDLKVNNVSKIDCLLILDIKRESNFWANIEYLCIMSRLYVAYQWVMRSRILPREFF